MACEKASVIQDIRKYIADLRENGISVGKKLLFGSWDRKILPQGELLWKRSDGMERKLCSISMRLLSIR
jgi:hypothetical protein